MRFVLVLVLVVIAVLPIVSYAQGWYVVVGSGQVLVVVSPINSTYILNVIGGARCCVYAEVYELTYQPPLINELANLAQKASRSTWSYQAMCMAVYPRRSTQH